MMKKCMLIILTICFVSCEKEDDSIDASLLIGKWFFSFDSHKPPVRWNVVDLMSIDCYTETTYYHFYDDKTYLLNYGEGNCYTNEAEAISGEWRVDGSNLILLSDTVEHKYKVKTLSGTKLQLNEGSVKEEISQAIDQFGNPVWEDSNGDGTFEPVLQTYYDGVERVQLLRR